MQPHRYFNELDHWRTVAQRPHPSSPPLSPTMKSASSAAVETGKTSPAAAAAADPFAVEGSRGWLEYAPVSEAGTSSMTLATGAGTKTKDKRNNASSSSTAAAAAATSAANRTHGDSQQKKVKELLAVSNEDILNLTKMTAQLPDRTGGGNSNNNNNSKKYHHDHRNNKPAKKERTFASTEHLPSSVSTNNNNNSSSSSNNVYPSLTRPSLSTPSPSNRNKINNNSNSSSGSNNEHRRSWYKHFIKGRDKGKGRMDINETQQQQPTTTSSASMIRDGSHHSSSNNSALTTNTGSSIAAVGDPLKLFMSAHHHPMSVITTTTTSESSSEEGGNNKKFSTSSLIKLRSHRRTSSESPLNRAPSAATRVPKRRSSNLKFQRRHSLDSIRAPDDYDAAAAATVASAQAPGGSIHPPVPLFSTPEPISGEQTSNNNVLGSDLTHLDETDLSGDDNILAKKSLGGSSSGMGSEAATSDDDDNDEQPEQQQQQQKQQENVKQLMLDYDTLPAEVLGLLRKYEKQGKMQVEERRVKTYYKRTDDDEEEEEEVDDEDVIDASELVSTTAHCHTSGDDTNPVDDGTSSIVSKRIAMVQASRSDKAEFVKLVHLTDGNSMRNGYLLDLHVSMLGSEAEDEEENHSEDIQILLQKVDRRIETLQHLAQDAKQFMEDNKEALDALAFDDEGNESSQYSPWPSPANSSRQPSSKSIHSIKEVAAAAAAAEEIKKKRSAFSLNTTSSSTTTTTSSSSSLTGGGQQRHYSSSIRRVPSSLLLDPHNLPYGSVNPFDYRQEEVRLGVCALESEMTDFKRELQGTQDLIRDIQIDINDTRQRMSLYIKDIPETHYSALKKLEVDVESILANRAKNPWLDTGYALLSYLLTLFALLVWIIICGLKWGRTVILFPRKLWRTYTEYLVERDKAVKKASLRSVSPGSNRNSRHLHHHHAVASDTLSRPSRPPLTSASSSSLSSRPKSRTIVNQHHLHSPCLEQS